jgi:uncharacterized protein YjbI with pentapeptide repeats
VNGDKRMPRYYTNAMRQLTIRSTSVNLPHFQDEEEEEAILEKITSTRLADTLVSRFELKDSSVRALNMERIKLMDGRLSSLRSEATNMHAAEFLNIELINCDLGSLHWASGKVSRTRFTDCKLLGARFENVTMEHVIFIDCKLDYTTFNRIRAAGPVIFIRCSLREAEFSGCDLTGTLWDKCNLAMTSFGNGKYSSCDLRGNDLSTARGVYHLRRVIIADAQLLQLSEALASELEVTFGSDEDTASNPTTQ